MSHIVESLGRLKDGIFHKEEIAHRKKLQAIHRSEDIMAANCYHLKIPREDLLQKGGENRKIAIYIYEKIDRYDQQPNWTSICRTQLLCYGEGVSEVLSGGPNEQASKKNFEKN